MKTIGIDPSLNSTGITVKNGSKTHYYLIISSDKYKSKAALQAIHNNSNPRLTIYIYDKQSAPKKAPYSQVERTKTHNLYSIYKILYNILKKEKPQRAVMEGVSYGSVGHVADLAGLNYLIRSLFLQLNIDFVIVSPSENKKNATGNGSAEKEEMIFAWHNCDDIYKNIDSHIKVDDIADSFFLANYYDYNDYIDTNLC